MALCFGNVDYCPISALTKKLYLIVSGQKVGTVTFSEPQRDANGVDIYSKMTVEVFYNSPVAITNITFDDPETSTYEGSQHSTNGNLKIAEIDLSFYQTLGIINFSAPINEEENIIFTGSIAAANDSQTNVKDPCIVAKELTSLAANQTYQKAVVNIKTAAVDKLEHSITLGKTNGQITASAMENGLPGEVYVTSNWPGAFTVLHNHPNNTPPSGGDIYAIARLNKNNSNFYSCFAIAGGEMYAIAITDLAAAQEFSARYLVNRAPGDDGEYPEFMTNEIMIVWRRMKSYTVESEAKAKAFVVNKYNAGITFFKQNGDGIFYPLTLKEKTESNGSKSYSLIPCI
ncbi:hypothetical protein [Flavobacterium sp.]|uniref:hypothetical protein n=1 Tax=Flavobacterium sp. TaxID=239 RepID=UPI0031D973DC